MKIWRAFTILSALAATYTALAAPAPTTPPNSVVEPVFLDVREATARAVDVRAALKQLEPGIKETVTDRSAAHAPSPSKPAPTTTTTFSHSCGSGGTVSGTSTINFLTTSASASAVDAVISMNLVNCSFMYPQAMTLTGLINETLSEVSTITAVATTVDRTVTYNGTLNFSSANYAGVFGYQDMAIQTTATIPNDKTAPTVKVTVSGTYSIGGTTYHPDPSSFALFQ